MKLLNACTIDTHDAHASRARNGRHQPRHSIWRLFSKVLVLSKGRQLFFGTTAAAEAWFTGGLGRTMPPDTSSADFIVDQANVDFDYEVGLRGDSIRKEGRGRARTSAATAAGRIKAARDIDEVGRWRCDESFVL